MAESFVWMKESFSEEKKLLKDLSTQMERQSIKMLFLKGNTLGLKQVLSYFLTFLLFGEEYIKR